MRYLILSDIHANLEALEAVVEDAAGLYQKIVCLGDIVGYGPDPNGVVAWVRENCSAVIRGNHDKASVGLDDLRFFNPVARMAAEWTYSQLANEHKEFVCNLPRGPLEVNGFRIVHGAPTDEDVYLIVVEDAWPELDIIGNGLVFFGHTHIQGGFHRDCASLEVREIGTAELLSVSTQDGYLVNPGSVGQPRDNDWRAAYAIYDSETRQLEYRRRPYDVDATQRKIVAAGLPSMLAERLALGR